MVSTSSFWGHCAKYCSDSFKTCHFGRQVAITDFFLLHEAVAKSFKIFRLQGHSVGQHHPTVTTISHPIACWSDPLLRYTGLWPAEMLVFLLPFVRACHTHQIKRPYRVFQYKGCFIYASVEMFHILTNKQITQFEISKRDRSALLCFI